MTVPRPTAKNYVWPGHYLDIISVKSKCLAAFFYPFPLVCDPYMCLSLCMPLQDGSFQLGLRSTILYASIKSHPVGRQQTGNGEIRAKEHNHSITEWWQCHTGAFWGPTENMKPWASPACAHNTVGMRSLSFSCVAQPLTTFRNITWLRTLEIITRGREENLRTKLTVPSLSSFLDRFQHFLIDCLILPVHSSQKS